jgi:hypothetical protein
MVEPMVEVDPDIIVIGPDITLDIIIPNLRQIIRDSAGRDIP